MHIPNNTISVSPERVERVFINPVTEHNAVSQGYDLSMDSIVPVALSLILHLDCVKEIIIPAGCSGAFKHSTKEPLRLVMTAQLLRWFLRDTLYHQQKTPKLIEEFDEEGLAVAHWFERPLEEALLPVGNRLFRKYTTLPSISDERALELIALVDNTYQREIHITRRRPGSDSISTHLFTLDQTHVKGQYIILPD